MEHILRPVRLEGLVEALWIGDAGDDGDDLHLRIGSRDVEVGEVERAFRPLEQHEPGGMVGRDLTRQLAPGRPPPAGDNDRLTPQVPLPLAEVDLHWKAP